MSFKLEQLPEKFRLGHEFIDGQHELLFQLFKELSEFCENEETELEFEIDIILLSLKPTLRPTSDLKKTLWSHLIIHTLLNINLHIEIWNSK